MHPFLRNLQRQTQENPAGALAAGAVVMTAITKTLSVLIEAKATRTWAKEVKRRTMKDALK